MIRIAGLSILGLCLVLTAPVLTQEDTAAAARVILHVTRNLEIPGHVELEDDDVIVIRDRDGEVQSFPKTRLLAIVRLVEPNPGQEGVAIMRDGQRRRGIVIEDHFDHVIMEIEGIRATLKRSAVSHVVLEPTVDERYQQYKSTLKAGMYEQHLNLCRWLVREERFHLARKELEELLSQREMPEAQKLLRVVEAQEILSSPSKKVAEPETQPEERDPEPEVHDPFDEMIISAEDVNIIRVFEIEFARPPKVVVKPDTIRALIENYSASELIPESQTGRNALYRADPLQIVRLMFELRARELFDQIQVVTEPYSLNVFRQRVHDTWLMNNCATSRCHGGPDAGDFRLVRHNYKNERVRYTNLLILERLHIDPDWPLIDYENPDRSLLIQYALPRNVARIPHPEVDGWKPVFNRNNQKLKDLAVEWIQAMMQPRPMYPVTYEVQPEQVESEIADDSEESEPPIEPEK